MDKPERLYKAIEVARVSGATFSQLENWHRIGLCRAVDRVSAKGSKVYDKRGVLIAYLIGHLRPASLADLEKLVRFLTESPLFDLNNVRPNAQLCLIVPPNGPTIFAGTDGTGPLLDEAGEPVNLTDRPAAGARTLHQVWLYDTLLRVEESLLLGMKAEITALRESAAERQQARQAERERLESGQHREELSS
jgi:DNA-binding transcriptional MerR regulator